jgi:UDP-N-acetylmuramate dehydrogenase
MHDTPLVPLSTMTTLRLGGPAKRLVHVESADELARLLRELDGRGEPVLILGGGSNLVIADEGFPGVVVKLAFSRVEVGPVHAERTAVTVDAGADWDPFVARAVAEGWSGVECLSGIPGSVGATPMQNVGAYGQEVSDTIERVEVFDREAGGLAWIAAAECGFGYRSSRFRGSERYVVTRVAFGFARDARSSPLRYAELTRALGVEEGARASAAEVRETVIRLRRGKGMVIDADDPESVSAGSFFTNALVDAEALRGIEAASSEPVPRFAMGDGTFKVPAAWLIERAGFKKGYTRGKVSISRKHALALVNRGGATTADLLALAREVQGGVKARFGVSLSAEPVMVGCSLTERGAPGG